jgi:YD repeat-containing protein
VERGFMGRAVKVLSLLICIFIFLPSPSTGDSVEYFYDDSGRLVRVVKGTERILYQYDEVGNLISISKEDSTPQELPPVLQGIDPDIFLIGGNYNVIITGQNLLTTSSVTTDNPNITVKFITAIDTKINAVLSISNTASPGSANLTVTTSYGSASMAINLYKAKIVPEAISLFPVSTASLSVSLTPSASKDLKVAVINKNPEIIDTQSYAVIPAGGSGNFTVKAIKEGTGTIEVGSTEATVFVVGEGGLIDAAPVSVLIIPVPDNALIYSSPVSVHIGGVYIGEVLSLSNGVSIAWPVIMNSSTSLPVSVKWTVVQGAITVSMPVCVKIEN